MRRPIRDAIDRVLGDCGSASDRISIEACAMALLVHLGIEAFPRRVVHARRTDDEGDVVHELLVDGELVWTGGRKRARWISDWRVRIADL